MEDYSYIIARINMWIWGILGISCLAGVIFYGAWWHIGTVLVCFLMFMTNYQEAKELGSETTANNQE